MFESKKELSRLIMEVGCLLLSAKVRTQWMTGSSIVNGTYLIAKHTCLVLASYLCAGVDPFIYVWLKRVCTVLAHGSITQLIFVVAILILINKVFTTVSSLMSIFNLFHRFTFPSVFVVLMTVTLMMNGKSLWHTNAPKFRNVHKAHTTRCMLSEPTVFITTVKLGLYIPVI